MFKIYKTLPVQKDVTSTKEALQVDLKVLRGYRLTQIAVRTGWLDVTVSHEGKEERFEFALPASVLPARARVRRFNDVHAQVYAPREAVVAHPCLRFRRRRGGKRQVAREFLAL